jgi:hypothetical protein
MALDLATAWKNKERSMCTLSNIRIAELNQAHLFGVMELSSSKESNMGEDKLKYAV